VGDGEARALVFVESTLGYHSGIAGILTSSRKPDEEHCQVGSLTGAVASQKVTEAPKGSLRADGNRASSAKA
jgi:hypothetical protein